MNPDVEPPQPPQPHRPSTSCDRHPQEQFTGFCPSCLCERLSVLDPSNVATSSRKPPTAALKAIFKPSGPGVFPELRRSKSFSASKNEGFSGVFEPQRKSCDVRVRNTLCSLFVQDDKRDPNKKDGAGNGGRSSEIVEVEASNLGFSSTVAQVPVFEKKIECETSHEDDIEIIEEEHANVGVATANSIEDKIKEIVEENENELCQTEELKPMKDHIDLDSQTKKGLGRDFKEIAGSFWSAASVFKKKLQNWRQKQKLKKMRNGGGSARLPVEKPINREYRETQSEVADYGFGRRSCDTNPRFSLDAGRMSFDAARMSFDDPRYSFDEPRASWDGYMIGKTFPRMTTMLSVVEDDAPIVHHVMRSDTQIPIEGPTPARNSIDDNESLPGGSAQTKDYYSDSSSRRRKSLDRSNSIRKIVGEMDEMKAVFNAKVSPATVDYLYGPKLVPNRDLNWNSKSTRWSKGWGIWGLIHNRRSVSGNKDEDEDRYSRANGYNPKELRSNNSSVNWRNSSSFSGSRKNFVGSNGHNKKKSDEFVLERNSTSARYSTNSVDDGLLRFYLAPMRGSWRGGSGKSRGSHAHLHTHSITKSLLRLY